MPPLAVAFVGGSGAGPAGTEPDVAAHAFCASLQPSCTVYEMLSPPRTVALPVPTFWQMSAISVFSASPYQPSGEANVDASPISASVIDSISSWLTVDVRFWNAVGSMPQPPSVWSGTTA